MSADLQNRWTQWNARMAELERQSLTHSERTQLRRLMARRVDRLSVDEGKSLVNLMRKSATLNIRVEKMQALGVELRDLILAERAIIEADQSK